MAADGQELREATIALRCPPPACSAARHGEECAKHGNLSGAGEIALIGFPPAIELVCKSGALIELWGRYSNEIRTRRQD